jgi:translation initiation factor IF-1
MAKQDLIEMEGQVTHVSRGDTYKIVLDNDVEVLAKRCGKMRRYRIRVVMGDRVKVGLSPYDLTRGLIMYCYR